MKTLLIVVPLALWVTGCQSPQTTVKAPPLPAAPSAPSNDSPSTLTHGMVTTTVKKGVTTQADLLQLFGGPNVATTDKDGTEVWMYDKTSSTVSSSQAQSSSTSERNSAAAMAIFFGLPPVVGGGGAAASAKDAASVTQGTQNVTRSVKTITFIIKFNPDKTVKDYSVRQASY